MNYAILKEEEGGGETLDGTVCKQWAEYFYSIKTHSLMTQKNITVLHFDVARLPLRVKCPDSWLSRLTRVTFLITFIILQDFYMEPTHVGSDISPTFSQRIVLVSLELVFMYMHSVVNAHSSLMSSGYIHNEFFCVFHGVAAGA